MPQKIASLRKSHTLNVPVVFRNQFKHLLKINLKYLRKITFIHLSKINFKHFSKNQFKTFVKSQFKTFIKNQFYEANALITMQAGPVLDRKIINLLVVFHILLKNKQNK